MNDKEKYVKKVIQLVCFGIYPIILNSLERYFKFHMKTQISVSHNKVLQVNKTMSYDSRQFFFFFVKMQGFWTNNTSLQSFIISRMTHPVYTTFPSQYT